VKFLLETNVQNTKKKKWFFIEGGRRRGGGPCILQSWGKWHRGRKIKKLFSSKTGKDSEKKGEGELNLWNEENVAV